MPQNDYNQLIEKFQQFRQQLYNCFPHRCDSVMDLLDALSSNEKASSIVELCLSPLFRRHYSALYKTIVQFFQPSKPELAGEERDIFQQSLLKALAPLIPEPIHRKFHLFGLDTTPIPRPFAKTLEDRTYIHQPNTIKGNKPINIGHLYSFFSVLPERAQTQNTPWSIPLLAERVTSATNSVAVGLEQLDTVLNHCPIFPKQDLRNCHMRSLYKRTAIRSLECRTSKERESVEGSP